MPKAMIKPATQATKRAPPRRFVAATAKKPASGKPTFEAWLQDFDRRLEEAHRRADELLARLA